MLILHPVPLTLESRKVVSTTRKFHKIVKVKGISVVLLMSGIAKGEQGVHHQTYQANVSWRCGKEAMVTPYLTRPGALRKAQPVFKKTKEPISGL